MKKLFLISLILVASLSVSKAQVMQYGDNAFNIGLGIPSVDYTMRMPAIVFAYDHGFSQKVGIGYISGGAQLAFYSSGEDGYGYKYKHSYTTIGPRAAYHFDFKEITGNSAWDAFDIYAGIFAGFSIVKYKYEFDSIYLDDDKGTNVDFREDLFVGMRYTFADNLAVYAEAGYGVAYLSGGISFKF